MLTIAAIPKAFRDHIGIIQNNAIASWSRLDPKPEILLFGDDPGTAEAAQQYGARHVPIARNEYGTPILGELFSKGPRMASNPLFCYVNSDIILLDEFLQLVRRVADQKKRFLLIGQRTDMDITTPLQFDPGWQDQLRRSSAAEGVPYGPYGVDYFVFPSSIDFQMPPFAVGRPSWDNWLIYRARALRLPVIDATKSLLVIHQKHGYKHVPKGDGQTWEGPEGNRNLVLASGTEYIFTMEDSTHFVEDGRVRLILTGQQWKMRKLRLETLYPATRPFLKAWRALKRSFKGPK